MLRLTLIVHGKVQGVGYRYSIVAGLEKHQLDVTGFVYNRPDGSVEIVAEADIETLKLVRKLAHDGSGPSVVRDIAEKVEPIKERKYTDFVIKTN